MAQNKRKATEMKEWRTICLRQTTKDGEENAPKKAHAPTVGLRTTQTPRRRAGSSGLQSAKAPRRGVEDIGC